MLVAGNWARNQANTILFVLVDSANVEVPGLGATFTLQISKAGGAFAASTGVKAEIGNGWYRYTSTAAEANTVGPVGIRITGAGIAQQNLEYVVEMRVVNAVEYTYTVTNSVTGLPVEGVEVWFTTDAAGHNVVWSGVTDAFGVARDVLESKPWLDAGTYYVWRQKTWFAFTNPDVEIVS